MKINREYFEKFEASLNRRGFLRGAGCATLAASTAGFIGCDTAPLPNSGTYTAKMRLTPEQQAMLDGEHGPTIQKAMKTLVWYGDSFGATEMVPLDAPVHLVASFALLYFTSMFDILKDMIDAGLSTEYSFTLNPRPPTSAEYDNLNVSALEGLTFNTMYQQDSYEDQLKALGLKDEDAFSCTCYLNEVGNIPKRDQVIAFAESSAVSYANSALGARSNRNSGVIEIISACLKITPKFGYLTDEGRKAQWHINLNTSSLPDATVLGSLLGSVCKSDTPFISGLKEKLVRDGESLDPAVNAPLQDYLKDMGAGGAATGAIALYHVEGLTPEARDFGRDLIGADHQVLNVTDGMIADMVAAFPNRWAQPTARDPEIAFIGCPHNTFNQLNEWTDRLEAALAAAGRRTLTVHTVFTCSPHVARRFRGTPAYQRLMNTGAKISNSCGLMYSGNPLIRDSKRIISNSGKLRVYTNARYLSDAEIVGVLVTGRIGG